MALSNSKSGYGWVAIVMHWIAALTIFGLFGLGLYMDDLGYYDPWYKAAPDLHRSVGVLLAGLFLLRLLWRWRSPTPAALPGHRAWERRVAQMTHRAFYLLVAGQIISGYLISTAKGQGIDVFNWVTLPSLTGRVEHLEDWAGEVHEVLAWTLMGLAALHALGALKHHWVDRDETLKRMCDGRLANRSES